MKLKLPERRRFIRIEIPLKVRIEGGGASQEVVTKNISPIGMRFEIDRELDASGGLDLSLFIPTSKEPISMKGKVVWQKKVSLEDGAPFDVGLEIVEVADENKNTLLKYLCDLLYDSPYKIRL